MTEATNNASGPPPMGTETMLSIGVDATKDGAHVCLMIKGSEGTVQVIHAQFYAARTDGAGSIVQLPAPALYAAPPAAAGQGVSALVEALISCAKAKSAAEVGLIVDEALTAHKAGGEA